jgi:hypothetical protein
MPMPGDVALAEDVARHDLARGEDVVRGLAVGHQHARALVHCDAEVGERDAGPKRPGVEGGVSMGRAQWVLGG